MNKKTLLHYKEEMFEEYESFGNAKYLKICDRAKELLLDYFLNLNSEEVYKVARNIKEYEIDTINNLSPIEQIFFFAYNIYISEFFYQDLGDIETEVPFNEMLESLLKIQDVVNYEDKKYIIDFAFNFTISGKVYKYAIELDGYDYHSNKQQMEHDYKRENNLQQLGYKVIRFTGSQVYNNPYECVDNMMNIIVNDIKEITK